MSALARIARLSAAFFGSNLVRGGIAFVIALVVGRALGVERFGRWVLCTTWASTLTVVCDLGLGLLLPRDGARIAGSRVRAAGSGFRGAGSTSSATSAVALDSASSAVALGQLCGSALVLRLSLAIPAALAMIAGAHWLVSDAETIRGLEIAALLGVSGAAYGCIGSTFRSQPAQVPAVLTLETLWHAAQLLVSWTLLRAWPATAVGTLLAIAVAVQWLQTVSALVLWRFAFGADRIRIPAWHTMGATLVRAIPFAAAGIVANLQTRVGPLLIGYLSTQTEVGAFAAAAKFGATARLAPGAIFAGALPVLSAEHDAGGESAPRAFASFDRAFVLLAVATMVPGVLFARPLLRLIYGTAFTGAAPALVWISLGLAPTLTNSAAKIALYAAGAEGVATTWSAVSLAIQVATAAMLIPLFGGVGAAAAIAIGEAAIWLPLRRARTATRTRQRSSPRHAPAPTPGPPRPAVADVPDPATAR